ncbi:MAG: hypothetical protein ACUVXJ_18630 [Phycisphaerae bacterium]
MIRLSLLLLLALVWGCASSNGSGVDPNDRTMGEPEVIRIKLHRFVDIMTSYGRGERFEPHPYGHAVHTVAERILGNRDVMLVVELGADDICGPCKHNVGGTCDDVIDTSYRPQAPPRKQDWNLLIDQRSCKRLGLSQGDRLTARQFCERLRDQAGDITDIYREIPAEMTAERAKALQAGVRRFLSGS